MMLLRAFDARPAARVLSCVRLRVPTNAPEDGTPYDSEHHVVYRLAPSQVRRLREYELLDTVNTLLFDADGRASDLVTDGTAWFVRRRPDWDGGPHD